MWSAVALVCYLTQAENFEMNKFPKIEKGQCFTSVAPVMLSSKEQCLTHIAMALNKPDFTRPDMQIFSFSCVEWKNFHYKGEAI
jgi:hypothetical protein